MSDEYLKHVDPPQNEEGWIEYALQKLWSETDGYEGLADNAAAELSALRERVAEFEAERNIIAKHIRITLDDGTAPDNLADHVLLAMQEYDSMALRLPRGKA